MKNKRIDKHLITLILGSVILLITALLKDFGIKMDNTMFILNILGGLLTFTGLVCTI